MQEANHSGSQECNGGMLENRRDDSDRSIYEMTPDSKKTIEDIAAASSSGPVAVQEMDGSSYASEVSGEDAGSFSVSNDAANEGDKRQISLGEHNIGGGMNEETTLLAQEAALQSSFLMEGLLEAGSNLPDKSEESTSLEENLELPSSSRDILYINGEGGAVVVAAEGERKNTEEIPIHLVSGDGRTEEIKMAGADISEKAEETNTLEESSAGSPLSHSFIGAEGEDGTLAADEEGERRNDEKAMLESGRTQEEDGSSIPNKVLADEDQDPFYWPESTAVEDTWKLCHLHPKLFQYWKGEMVLL